MLRQIFLFVAISVVVFATTVFFRLGGHKEILIERRTQPELNLIYKEHLGPYHKINEVIVAVEQWSATANLPCPQTFGEYLDDPRTVEERRLRSLAGCVVATLPQKTEETIKFKTIPAREIVYAKFDGAPSIGPFKVYPAVEDWTKEHNLTITGPVIEVYTVQSPDKGFTEYHFPIQ